MREHIFKGKKKDQSDWVEGSLIESTDNKGVIVEKNKNIIGKQGMAWYLNAPSFDIVTESVCEFTGKYLKKKQKLFENDIVFEEVEEDEGDRRIYYVCKYVEAWGKYVFLTQGDLYCLEIETLENESELGIEDSEMLHYAGNYIDNPELLEKGEQK